MLQIDFIFDEGCPNVVTARDQLKLAVNLSGQAVTWKEWNRSKDSLPGYVTAFGSPTILVNGKDVAGENPVDEVYCCRLYSDKQGNLKRVPPVETILEALLSAEG